MCAVRWGPSPAIQAPLLSSLLVAPGSVVLLPPPGAWGCPGKARPSGEDGVPSCLHRCWVLLGDKCGLFCKPVGTLFCSGVKRVLAACDLGSVTYLS